MPTLLSETRLAKWSDGATTVNSALERYFSFVSSSLAVLSFRPIGPEDNTSSELESKLKYLSNAPLNVVAPSRHLAKRVSESKVGKAWNVVYIPNGVDTTKFSFERKADPVFRARFDIGAGKTSVLVANRNFKDPDKGFPIIRDALLRIGRANIHLLLAGEHSDWAAHQLPTALTFTDMGYVSSRETMAELYEASDIFLFASAAENFPCVILEAMSSKCCVVATPTSGVTEQISTEETGFLADDISAEALAKSLEKAVRSPELLSLYGDQARTRVNKYFSEDLMVGRHLELYDMIVRT